VPRPPSGSDATRREGYYTDGSVFEDAVAIMRSIKTALDPRGLLDPGKIFA
jgi:FAD/FMN-containing dehydrogenase